VFGKDVVGVVWLLLSVGLEELLPSADRFLGARECGRCCQNRWAVPFLCSASGNCELISDWIFGLVLLRGGLVWLGLLFA
jgi:hypothetical protein